MASARANGTAPCGRLPRVKHLSGLANVLRGPAQPHVTRRDYFVRTANLRPRASKNGKPYIGEYHDEMTGEWLITGPKAARSRDYNHSTFCDLVISGLVGIVPRADDTSKSIRWCRRMLGIGSASTACRTTAAS